MIYCKAQSVSDWVFRILLWSLTMRLAYNPKILFVAIFVVAVS